MWNRLQDLGLIGLLLATALCPKSVNGSAGSPARQDRDSHKPLQGAVASKTAKFGSVAKTDEAYTGALDAHDLAGAYKKVGQAGAFKGTVSKVFEERDGDLVILDFDLQYRTALTAVLKNPDFPKFPDLKALQGKELLVSGTFVDYRGKAEIVLISPEQIKLVK